MIPGLIYSFLYFIVLIFLLPFQYRKRSKEFRSRWLREKFGNIKLESGEVGKRGSIKSYDSQASELPGFRASKLIWIHAVSVGEVIAAIPLLYRLREKFTSINLLVSTITDTGQKVAIEKVPAGTHVIYLPFDLTYALKRALTNVKPVLFITMETELWPNLFKVFKREGIPIIIMNGRISDNSFKGYRRIKFFMRDIIGCVDLFGMQDSVYAQRIKELGASEDRVKVLGNFKFDTKPSENIPEWTKLLATPVIIAGSTHRGEEDLIISVFEKLKKDLPDLNLIIAPRHPERFGEVEELVKKKRFEYIKRSEIFTDSPIHPFTHSPLPSVIILDAIGELASVYSIADIAIIGGSFTPHGGQNLLEPAYWAKPIICGPHMENFPFVKEFYEKNAAIETTGSGLLDKLKELLKSPEKRKAIGNRARELYNEKAGAVERAVKEIERYLRNGNL